MNTGSNSKTQMPRTDPATKKLQSQANHMRATKCSPSLRTSAMGLTLGPKESWSESRFCHMFSPGHLEFHVESAVMNLGLHLKVTS